MLSRYDQDWLDREFGGGTQEPQIQPPSDTSQYDRDWLDREFGTGASDHLKPPSDVSAETQAVGIAPPTFWHPRDIEATLNREYKAAREDAWAEMLREIQAEQRREYLSALKDSPSSRAQPYAPLQQEPDTDAWRRMQAEQAMQHLWGPGGIPSGIDWNAGQASLPLPPHPAPSASAPVPPPPPPSTDWDAWQRAQADWALQHLPASWRPDWEEGWRQADQEANPEVNTWQNWLAQQEQMRRNERQLRGQNPELSTLRNWERRPEQAQQQRGEGMNVWGERQRLAEELRRARQENPETSTWVNWQRQQDQERQRAEYEKPEVNTWRNWMDQQDPQRWHAKQQNPEVNAWLNWWQRANDPDPSKNPEVGTFRNWDRREYDKSPKEREQQSEQSRLAGALKQYQDTVQQRQAARYGNPELGTHANQLGKLHGITTDTMRREQNLEKKYNVKFEGDWDDRDTGYIEDLFDRFSAVLGQERFNELLSKGVTNRGIGPANGILRLSRDRQDPTKPPGRYDQTGLIEFHDSMYTPLYVWPSLLPTEENGRDIFAPELVLAHEFGHLLRDAMLIEGMDLDQMYRTAIPNSPIYGNKTPTDDIATAIGLAILTQTGMTLPSTTAYTPEIRNLMDYVIIPALRDGPPSSPIRRRQGAQNPTSLIGWPSGSGSY